MEESDDLNPFDELVLWIFSQPREIQEEIAYSVLNFIPGHEDLFPDMDVETLPSKLQAWFDAQADFSIIARTSTIIFVRSTIDYFVMRSKGSKSSWQENKQLNEQVIADLRSQGEPTEPIDRVVQSMSFRQRLWGRAYQDWREFRDQTISDANLEDWFNARLDA